MKHQENLLGPAIGVTNMLVKCESKSPRVKGLAFHPRLSWLLVSLHNGIIQLWDYRLGSLIDKFEEHNGPVRGVNFHKSQPLFVSGGDDKIIRVWDYKHKGSVFSLQGHLDYIRTVQFHTEYPWICSSSDDQTIRIWNWQSRHCIAVLAGHHHYVMCATFHNTEDLLASASLDQTIRVWDLSGLREKTVSSSHLPGNHQGSVLGGGSGANDVFGATDAVCKYILEGHDRGVNWVAFHPTLQMIATGADDRMIKLWGYDDRKWWEIDTLRGHFNNVSALVFHPLQSNLLVSNSEDRTIRIWDLNKKTLLHSFRRENDRFWALDAQANSNLIAVGHDTGMVVFKLGRERPAAATWSDDDDTRMVFVKDWRLYYQKDASRNAVNVKFHSSHLTEECHTAELSRNTIELPKELVRHPLDSFASHPHALIRNPLNSAELNIAIVYKAANASLSDTNWVFDILSIPRLSDESSSTGLMDRIRTESGTCNSLVFCARNRYLTLNAQQQLYLHTISEIGGAEVKKRIPLPPDVTCDMLFYAGNNKVLLRGEESMILFDINTRKVLGNLNLTIAGSQGLKGRIRQVIWSPNGQFVALLSKHYVCLATNTMMHLTSLHECIRVKSGVWDDHNGFIYNTVSHVKFLLSNGDKGIFHSIPESAGGMYIQTIVKNRIIYLSRKVQLLSTVIDTGEELLKIALNRGKLDPVASLLKNKRLPGFAWIGYLKKKHFPEIAYQCVTDPATKAVLATEFADLEAALEAVKTLNNNVSWRRLGEIALKLGNIEIAERSFQKGRLYGRLIVMYVMTANTEKLRKLGKVLENLGDITAAFHISLLCGDIQERIELMRKRGLKHLAWMTAKRHGLDETADDVASGLEANQLDRLHEEFRKMDPGRLLMPPLPVSLTRAAQNWPLRKVPETIGSQAVSGTFGKLMKMAPSGISAADLSRDLRVDKSKTTSDARKAAADQQNEDQNTIDVHAWGGDDEDEWFLPDDTDAVANTSDTLPTSQDNLSVTDKGRSINYISKGIPISVKALYASPQKCVADLVAIGRMKEAAKLLENRIGLINVKPLIPFFRAAYQSAQSCIPTLPLLHTLMLPVLDSKEGRLSECPRLYNYCLVDRLDAKIKEGLTLFGTYVLERARYAFCEFFYLLILVKVNSEMEEKQVLEKANTACQYLTAVTLEMARSNEQDKVRDLELRVLATFCDLQPNHEFLLLKEATRNAVKSQNYIIAAHLARRIIKADFVGKIGGLAPEVERIKKILIQCESKATNAFELPFDLATSPEKARICCKSLKMLQQDDTGLICALCGATTSKAFAGNLCSICNVTELGRHVLGLSLRPVI